MTGDLRFALLRFLALFAVSAAVELVSNKYRAFSSAAYSYCCAVSWMGCAFVVCVRSF